MATFNAEQRREMHHRRGEGYRWFKAMRCGCYNPRTNDYDRTCRQHDKDGRIYVEQTVEATWKALIHSTEVDIEDRDFGLIPVGSARISVMPDETPLARLDKVILTGRAEIVRETVTRTSGTQYDTLSFGPLVAILSVNSGATVYDGDADYELASADRIHWLTGAPASSQSYSVEYTRQPTFVFLGVEDRAPRPSKTAVLMPQRGVLTKLQPVKNS